MKQRVDRLNSLLKEVISEVIKRDVKNPHVSELVTVTNVQITKDLHHAKVYISVIGNELTKQDTLLGLEASAGFIGFTASKKVVLRYFPTLQFVLDDGVSQHMRIEELLHEITDERSQREGSEDNDAAADDEELDDDEIDEDDEEFEELDDADDLDDEEPKSRKG